jgi:putative ABC transport system permease protein
MTSAVDVVVLAGRNILRSRLRSFLTMLGIFIGIAAVVSLVALSQGLKDSIQIQFDKMGADKLFISVKNSDFGQLSDLSGSRLTLADLDVVRKAPGVKKAASMLIKGGTLKIGDEQGTFLVLSLSDDLSERQLFWDMQLMEVIAGKTLRKNDENGVLIGYNIYKTGTFAKQPGPGTKVLVNGRQFTVNGLLKRTGDPGNDNTVYMSESTMRQLFNEPALVSSIFAQSAAGEDPLAVAETIRHKLRSFRGQKAGDEDFDVQTPNDILATLSTILNIIQVVLVGVSVISLIVGGIGIMNTMYTAVLERTNEIGVMKAVGARNSDILALFVVEAGFLGVVGGLVGIGLGAAIAYVASVAANYSLGSDYLIIYFPWYLIAGTLLFAFVIGSLSGALPAWQASKLQPVEALRYE